MANFDQEPSFNAPIAGQGLTGKLGNFPWQQPPQFNTVEETSQYYIQRVTDKQFVDDFLDTMELGVPLTTIANSLQISGVMQGIHNIDVGMLVTPVIMEILAYIGDMYDIEYNMGTELDTDDKPSGNAVALALRKVKKKLKEDDLEKAKPEETIEPEQTEEGEEGEPVMIALMARRG